MESDHESDFLEIAMQQGLRYESFDIGTASASVVWMWFHAGGWGATVAAIAMTVRTYINRRQGNAVTVWRDGKKLAEIKGEMSAEDIVKILEAREQAEEPTALTADDDQTAPGGP